MDAFFLSPISLIKNDFTDAGKQIGRILKMQRMEFTVGMKAVVKICVIGVQICSICDFFA